MPRHGAQLTPLEITHVQAVTVICIGSQAEESEQEEEEEEELRMRQGCSKWSWQHNELA